MKRTHDLGCMFVNKRKPYGITISLYLSHTYVWGVACPGSSGITQSMTAKYAPSLTTLGTLLFLCAIATPTQAQWWHDGDNSEGDHVWCRSNKYLDEHGMCQWCPTHSTSWAGSTSIAQCKCRWNYWMDFNLSQCIQCPADSWSPHGSTSPSQCKCNINHYDDSGTCKDCPQNSQSLSGADTLNDCKCNSGSYENQTDSSCITCPNTAWSAIDTQSVQGCFCPEDKYMNPDFTECLSCPSNAHSFWGSTSNLQCSCQANYYLNTGTMQCDTCPPGSTSREGATGITDCMCPANTRLDTVTKTCVACGPGLTSQPGSVQLDDCNCGANQYFDNGLNSCQSCPTTSVNPNGGLSIESCLCPADKYMDVTAKQCALCPTGSNSDFGSVGNLTCSCTSEYEYINDAFTTCEKCPGFSKVNKTALGKGGARQMEDCECFEFRTLDTSTETCNLTCPSNTYVDNPPTSCFECPKDTYLQNNACAICPIYSEAPKGSDSISDCTCVEGTYYDTVISQCKPCGIGFYCPGNSTRIDCQTANPTAAGQCHIPLSTLTAFSTKLNQCACWTQGQFPCQDIAVVQYSKLPSPPPHSQPPLTHPHTGRGSANAWEGV